MTVGSLYFEITDACNLHCVHCYNRSGNHKNQLDAHAIVKYATEALKYGLCRITLSGGEPLCHPEIRQILESLRVLSNIELRLLTNGIGLLNSIEVGTLNPSYVSIIQISLDSANEDTYSIIRSLEHWSKLLSDIRIISKICKLHLKMTVCKENIHQIQDFFDLCMQVNCIPVFNQILPLGRAKDRYTALHLTTKDIINISVLINTLYEKYGYDEKFIPYRYNCALNGNSPMSWLVKSTGYVQPCEYMYDDVFCIGHIDSNISDALLHPRFESLCTHSKNRLSNATCARCVASPVCEGGCMAHAYFSSSDIDGDDQGCNVRKLLLIQRMWKERPLLAHK